MTCNKCGHGKSQSLMAKRRISGRQRPRRICLDCAALRLKQLNVEMRAACFTLLGGECDDCGESEPEFLTVDHVNGDGAEERLTLHPDQIKRLIVSGKADLSRYRVLCRNCNDEDGILSRSPSTKAVDTKHKVMNMLGGKCSCCSEDKIHRLTVDHVNNDGASRSDLPRGGIELYLKILSGLALRSDFQALCWSCNFSKHLGGGICVHRRKEV